MNKKIVIIIIFIIFTYSINAQQVTLGSSLRELTNLISNDTKIEMINLGIWIENEIFSYEITPKYSLLVSANYYPFGVLVKENNPYFLIDVNGDSILNHQTTILHVPFWIVSHNSKEKSNNRNVIQLFDLLYRTFQNNELPHGSTSVSNIVREIVQAGNNLSYINRDLIYGFYLYDKMFSSGVYNLSLIYLNNWNLAIVSRFQNTMHPLIYIYSLETLYKLNEFNVARTINNQFLQNYPNCIIGKVYQVLLEANIIERNRLRDLVIRNYSEHWFVKEKLL